VTVLNADQDATRNLAPMAPGRLLWFSISSEVEGCFTADRGQGRQIYIRADGAEHAICTTDAVQLCGEHNLQNICAAAAAAASMGAEPDAVRDAVTAFKGLEHRLEFVREADGIKYYDDSFATTPEASAVAIRAFRGPLVVIAGGADKGSDYRPFAEAILTEKVKAVVLIGVMGDKIGRTISALAVEMQRPLPKLAEGPEDIKGIVAAARSLADHGDVVLLSTACASFGLFRNYKERGDLFKQAVWEL
jgi:UDP-N-acetylmuramoylalanine--D-glutamate ligase